MRRPINDLRRCSPPISPGSIVTTVTTGTGASRSGRRLVGKRLRGFREPKFYKEVATAKNRMVSQVKRSPEERKAHLRKGEERLTRLRRGFTFTNHSRIQYCRQFLFTMLVFSPAAICGWMGDYLAMAVCTIAVLGAWGGYCVGASSIFSPIAALATAIASAPFLGKQAELVLSLIFGTTGLTNRFLSAAILGLMVLVVVTTLLLMIASKVLRYRERLANFNHWFGLGVGGLAGPAAILFFIGGMLMFEPTIRQRQMTRRGDDEQSDLASSIVLATTEFAGDSRLGATIVEYNPFVRIPQLNKMDEIQRAMAVLRDPAKIRVVLRHPSIRQLQQRPEVKVAMDKLIEEPAIQEILRSRDKMNRSMAMSLLNHPALLELVDQPDFLSATLKVIRGMQVSVR